MLDVRRWRSNLRNEIDAFAIYRAMARAERQQAVILLYEHLAAVESRHARVWGRMLRANAAWPGMPRPSLGARILILVIGRLGPDVVERTLAARESQERRRYDAGNDETSAMLRQDEQLHGHLLSRIASAKLSGATVARLGNALRAGVLGITDGLVSNVSLLMGVAGAGGDSHAIVVAGLAGLLAGSLSMALGEWLSVQSSRELYERQIMIEAERIVDWPTDEIDELARIYRSRGLSPEDARATAAKLVEGSVGNAAERAVVEAAEVADLGGSSWVAAAMSFFMFAAGATIPLLPFLLLSGAAAPIASAVLTGIVLFAIGSIITTITGKSALRAGLRQLAIGFCAAIITYTLGRLLGVALA